MLIVHPGRRGLGFGHAALFRNLASCHQISIDSFLLQMKHGDKDLYWTLMRSNGALETLPEELVKELKVEGAKPAESTVMQGGLT